MNRSKKIFALLMAAVLLVQCAPLTVKASDMQYRINIQMIVDGVDMGYIPAVDSNYENNMFISLKGLAYALKSTQRAFTPVVEKKKIAITWGSDDSLQAAGWTEEALETVVKGSAGRYEMHMDETELKYYSFILPFNGGYDAFLTPVSLAMMFDMDMKVTKDKIEINTSQPFSVTAEEMEECGYLQGVNALLIGDSSTGDIFYQYKADEAFPIASTTKLMTYLILMEAVSEGQCSLQDTVTISEQAAKLSNGPDGVIPMLAGSKVPITELIYGMLLPSSNECALAVAEHVAGSQEAFVARMNEKAKAFGWENAQFYNCHGLPCFEDQLIPAKIHNHMTAAEMFDLATVIMDVYPQITEFTSAKTRNLASFGIEVKNTNSVLYNMDNVVGLKTGTTNKAGACLVTCVPAVKDGKTHYLIVVLFGAEGDASRGIASEMAARYAVEVLRDGKPGAAEEPEVPEENDKVIPEDPELVVSRLIRFISEKGMPAEKE